MVATNGDVAGGTSIASAAGSTQPTRVIEPARAYAILALACAIGLGAVLLIGRSPVPTRAAALALATMTALALALYGATRISRAPSQLRLAALLVIALLTAVPAYFFGPNSAFAAIVALSLALVGLLAGIDQARLSRVGGWLLFGALAAGQALCVALVLLGRLPDRSLTPLITGGHPYWHYATSHVFILCIYLAAYLAGRALQQRYAALTTELESTLRATSLRDALLDEARTHYRRALAHGRAGLFSGQSLGGYRLGALIARGGAGEVYEAASVADGSPAAIKLLRGDKLDDPATAARFLEETQVSKRIVSPHVVRVYAAGGLAEKLPFIAMERLGGDDLLVCIRRDGPLEAQAARSLAQDIGNALGAIHRAGLLHLDVSPRNILRVEKGWKLIDFGVARAQDLAAGATGELGTRAYAAPERLAGGAIDARADVYGLAACLHFALAGKEFAGALDPILPPQVAEALGRGLAAQPQARFANIDELRDAVLAALDVDVLPTRIEVASPPAERAQPETVRTAPTPPSPATTYAVSRVWDKAYRGKMRSFYLAITGVCIGGALYLGWLANERGPQLFAIACIAGIVIMTWIHRAVALRVPADVGVNWPWAIVGVLSIGPAYSIGLHSGFATVVTSLLFCGGAFRTTHGYSWTDRRGLVLAAICISHAVCFALIWTGVIGDLGNVPVLPHNLEGWQALLLHLLVQSVFVLALFAGLLVDDRYRAVLSRLESAVRDAAQKEALLVTAREELDRALGAESEGLFTGQSIGRFRALRLIARGGMGEVYEAVDPASGERVALKLIRRDMVANPRTQRLFANEASTVERVRSPFVARVIETGGLDGELPFLAMEYIEGRSLAALLRERGRLPLDDLRRLISDVSTGLRDVHEAGVLHRDVKPDNVMLTQVGGTPCWKLVDFGVAKLMVASTTENLVVGTPAYMAPEQLAAGRLDARTDLYSFCAVIYRALTGRAAFGEHDRAPNRKAPPDPRRYVDLSMELEMVLRIGLAETPADRFASATELREVFLAALDERLADAWHERGIAILAAEPWGRLSAEPEQRS